MKFVYLKKRSLEERGWRWGSAEMDVTGRLQQELAREVKVAKESMGKMSV